MITIVLEKMNDHTDLHRLNVPAGAVVKLTITEADRLEAFSDAELAAELRRRKATVS